MESLETDFRGLFQKQAPGLYRLALGFLGKDEEAADLVQETFLKAWAAREQFRGESQPSTWLWRICVNTAQDRLRQRRRLPIQIFTEDEGIPYEDIVEAHPGDDPVVTALAGDIKKRCLHCFSECLPRRQRQVFCLSHVMEFSQGRIAEILGIQPGAVKASLFRARQRMDGFLNDRCVFLKAENPCDCRQWVRFALKRGIVHMPENKRDLEKKADRVKQEIGSLLDLHRLYRDLYQDQADEEFNRRLKMGVNKREWFSL